ncbi:MAG: FAD-dependent monooxygenase [Burkholderiales bacterium]
MPEALDCEVLIAGAGPAGLCLAIELGSRGIRCLVVDPRAEVDPHPRASLLGARSMEYLRRHGLAAPILAAGLPTHFRYDVRFVTSLTGHLLHHYASPSPDEYGRMHRGEMAPTEDAMWSPYFKVQIGQHAIEPVLRERAAQLPSVQLALGASLQGFDPGDDDVRATIALPGGGVRAVRARYLAGCDGGRSLVRQALGIPYVGRGAIGRNRSFLFHSPGLLDAATTGRANLHFVFQPGRYGVIVDIDGRGLYNYSWFTPTDEATEADGAALLRAVMGRDFAFTIRRSMEWFHHQSVADTFRVKNVFLVGDAAHLFCPSGGIGMNTAIGDAFDLGWKLAARSAGWGGERLLDSYELERRPVAMRNTAVAADNRDRIDSVMQTLPASIADDGPVGEAARAWVAPRLRWLARQFSSMGAHLGARYHESPIVVRDGSPEPADDPRIVVPSTWPGCRAPHAWLRDGRSTLDWYDGRGYVLVCHEEDAAARSLAAAAREERVPLRIEAVDDTAVRSLYERPYVLVRPDGHVCWRGAAIPDDARALVRAVSGH